MWNDGYAPDGCRECRRCGSNVYGSIAYCDSCLDIMDEEYQDESDDDLFSD